MKFPVTIRHRTCKAKIYAPGGKFAYYRLAYSTAGKRRMQTFANYSDAKTAAERIVRELANGSQAAALNASQSRDALAALQRLESFRQATGKRLSLLAVVSEHVGLLEKLNGRSPGEAVEGFLQTVVSVSRQDVSKAVELFLGERKHKAEAKDGKPDEADEDDGAAKQGEFKTVEKSGELIDGYRRRSAITDAILADFRAAYEKKITKEDIFYYIYGALHSPEYRTRFASDLKKMLPRIPFTSKTADFWKFSQAGRDLAEWHLNYETVKPYAVQEHTDSLGLDPAKDFLVNPKMIFGRANKQVDKTTIIYNSHVSISGIPLEAYDYVVNGKPAIEWIMERYQITVDKDSGIRNDPNDWAREHGDPKYILNLLKRVITVSLETMKIVNTLPALNERK